MTPPAAEPTTSRSIRPIPAWVDFALLLAIVALAAGLRAYQLGYKSLWLDEVTYVRSAQMGGLFGPYGLASISHPPAYLFILRLVSTLGREEWLLRLPALIASTLGVVAVWGLGRILIGRAAALLAAFMLALSALHLEYAQEAHSYALFGTLSTLLLWSLAWLAGRVSKPAGAWSNAAAWSGFVVLAAFALYVHYYAFIPVGLSVVVFPCFLLAAQPGPVASLWRDAGKRRALLYLAVALMVVGLLFLPQAGSQLIGSARVAADRSQALEAGTLETPFDLSPALFGDTILAFITNRTPWSADPLFVMAVVGLWLVGLVWLLWRRRSVGVAFLVWMLLPLPVVAWFAYRSGFSFAPRRLIFILPVFLLVCATGVTAVGRMAAWAAQRIVPGRPTFVSWASWATIALVTLGFVKGSVDPLQATYARPKQDWKGLAMILRTVPQPDDAIVVLPNATSALDWYYPGPHNVIAQDLVPKLQTLCEKSHAVYVVVAGTGERLEKADADWLVQNYIRVPLKDLRLYYRNCQPGAWYGDGAEELFKLARHPGLNFPQAGKALDEYRALASQGVPPQPAAMPTPPPTNQMPTPPPTREIPATPAPVAAATPAPEPAPELAATIPATAPSTILPDPVDGFGALLTTLAKDRDDAVSATWLGAYQARLGDIEQAQAQFERAVALDPASWLAYALEANALATAGQSQQAQDAVARGLEAIPDSVALVELQARLAGNSVALGDDLKAVLDAGRAALREQDWTAALAAGQQAVALEPRRYETFLLLGDAYRAAGEPSQALASYQRAAEGAPQVSVLHSRQSEMASRLGQPEQALDTALLALALEEGRWENWLSLGRTLAERSKTDRGYRAWAEAALEQAVALAPEGSQAPARLLAEFRAAQP